MVPFGILNKGDLMLFQTLLIEEKEDFLILTVNRPEKLNALSNLVLREMKEFLLSLQQDKYLKVRGLILTGAGEKSFIAGADIQAMSAMLPAEARALSSIAQEVTQLIESLPIPVIAAVNGYALGGGCEIAISCDYIYGTRGAVFGQPEVNLGLIPGFGGCVRLARLIGISRAKELIFTGRNLNAVEAERVGLVLKVFDSKDEMLVAALESLKLIRQKSGSAVALAKKTVQEAIGRDTKDALQIENANYEKVFQTENSRIGIQAFLQKRKPQFVNC